MSSCRSVLETDKDGGCCLITESDLLVMIEIKLDDRIYNVAPNINPINVKQSFFEREC